MGECTRREKGRGVVRGQATSKKIACTKTRTEQRSGLDGEKVYHHARRRRKREVVLLASPNIKKGREGGLVIRVEERSLEDLSAVKNRTRGGSRASKRRGEARGSPSSERARGRGHEREFDFQLEDTAVLRSSRLQLPENRESSSSIPRHRGGKRPSGRVRLMLLVEEKAQVASLSGKQLGERERKPR